MSIACAAPELSSLGQNKGQIAFWEPRTCFSSAAQLFFDWLQNWPLTDHMYSIDAKNGGMLLLCFAHNVLAWTLDKTMFCRCKVAYALYIVLMMQRADI